MPNKLAEETQGTRTVDTALKLEQDSLRLGQERITGSRFTDHGCRCYCDQTSTRSPEALL
jgi:hypothetical protein